MHIDRKSCPELWTLVRMCGYTGYDLEVKVFSGPRELSSYWSGGTRQMWHVVRLTDRKIMTLPECGGHWCQPDAQKITELPEDFCLVNVSEGHMKYATIYFNELNLNKYLPAASGSVPNAVQVVLHYVASRKSSYGGISNYRFHAYKEDGGKMSQEEWDAAKAEGYRLGLLNKAGAITPAGRNLRETVRGYLSLNIVKHFEGGDNAQG